MMVKNKQDYLTTFQAAEILGFSSAHIRRLCSAGKIKADKIGNTWLMHKADLKKAPRKRIITPKEEPTNGSNQ